MDIKRDPPKKTKQYVGWAIGLLAIVVVSIGVSRLKPAAPSVDRATQWIDSVRFGEMRREVSAPGTLVPEHVRIIVAMVSGRVEQLPVRPGETVGSNQTIVELSNSDIELQTVQFEQQLTGAHANLAQLKNTLRQQRLSQEGTIASIRTQYMDAVRQAAMFDSLDKRGLASAHEVAAARDRVNEMKTRVELETRRLEDMVASEAQQIRFSEQQIVALERIVAEQRKREASMRVVAGESGQLQSLGNPRLELGQWVNAGIEIARVSQPGRLKALLRVAESQVRDVAVGQRVRIDLHNNAVVEGRVSRIDPASQAGTVLVEADIVSELPPGARPDLSVDGTIEIERLTDVAFVGRPAYGTAESTIGLFKLSPDGKEATRVTVRLGRASVNTVQVISGLEVGDRVIISDMSAYDNHQRVRIR